MAQQHLDPASSDHDVALAIEILERLGGEALKLWLRRRGARAEVLRARVRALFDAGLVEHAPAPPEVERIDRFRVLVRLGAGAVGVVYLAVDDELERLVAIKWLASDLARDERVRERFRREARTLAALRGPGCVPVLGVGECEGRPYTVLEFVLGVSLEDGLARLAGNGPARPASVGADDLRVAFGLTSDVELDGPLQRIAARWMGQVAEACVEAHALGVLHRDIKPSNVMVDDCGHARLLDFGLAHVRDDARMTWSRDLVGTPRYMAPEAIRQGAGEVGARADVYALGLCLHELLTLVPAFDAPSAAQVMVQVLERDVELPSRRNPLVPRDLDAIVAVATAKEPERRYLGAREFADDLASFLAGRPARARVPSAWERLVRTARRRPALTGLWLAVVGLVLLTLFLVAAYGERLRVRGEQAVVAQGAAQSTLEFLREVLELSDVEELGPQVPAARLLHEGAARVKDDAQWESDSVVRPRLARLLGALLWGSGDLVGASELLELALRLLDRPCPAGHDPEAWLLERAQAWNFLSNVQRMQGRLTQAEASYRSSLSDLDRVRVPEGRALEATVHFNLADLLQRRQEIEEAVAHIRVGIELETGDDEESRVSRLYGLTVLGSLETDAKDLAAAAEALEDAQEVADGLRGHDSLKAKLLDARADLALVLQDPARACQLYLLAATAFESTFGPASQHVGLVWRKAGDARDELGDVAGAHEAFTRARAILEPAGAGGFANLRLTRLRLGLIQAEMGDLDEARRNLEWFACSEPVPSSSIPSVWILRGDLARVQLHARAGEIEQARQLLTAIWRALPPDLPGKRYPEALRALVEAELARVEGDPVQARCQLERARRERDDAIAEFGEVVPDWLDRALRTEQAAQGPPTGPTGTVGSNPGN